MQDRLLSAAEIKTAVQQARQSAGPLQRLVMMFDSCYSGALLDPLRRNLTPLMNIQFANEMADSVMNEFTQTRDGANYWNKIFVFASSRADETSAAGEAGSEFTVAMKKAFDETIQSGTVGEFIKKAQQYTVDHHPVARLVPLDMNNEKMAP